MRRIHALCDTRGDVARTAAAMFLATVGNRVDQDGGRLTGDGPYSGMPADQAFAVFADRPAPAVAADRLRRLQHNAG